MNGNYPVAQLTKRELFAAMALQSLLNEDWYRENPERAAEIAVAHANNLLDELEAGQWPVSNP